MNKRLLFIVLSIVLSTLSSWAVDFSKLNLNRSTYYVKIGGTGDGSSWKNALGNIEFNYVLANAQEGTTFHIAAGRYVPVLDYYLELTSNKNSRYTIKTSVTLIGGYPESPSDGDVSDPSKFETLFSADIKDDNIPTDYRTNRDDDIIVCLSIGSNNKNGEYDIIRLYGLSFDGCKSEDPGFNRACGVYECIFEAEKCRFKGCYNGLSLTKCKATITDCTFEHNNEPFLFTAADLNINKSTFSNNSSVKFTPNETYFRGDKDDPVHRTINVDNCTFFNNSRFLIEGKSDSEVNLTNNTIVMSDTTFTVDSKGQVNLIGNIINAKKIDIGSSFAGSITSKYNYLAYTDKLDSNFKSSKNWESNSCPFLANKLASNGGYTNSLALLKEKLSDGTSLRFPRSECGLAGDQRNLKRAESTCVGAYEFGATVPAPIYRTVGPDTIFVDKPYFADNKIHPIGKDTMVKTIKDAAGNDSIITTYYLYVRPRFDIQNYYVTKTGSGNKSGLSWENAMNDTSFAFAFPLVADNTTFHIAEGIFHPIYGKDGNSPEDFKERMFYTERSVNLIGGYPESNPTEGPNANKYKTIFSGEVNLFEGTSLETGKVDSLIAYKPSTIGSVKITGIKAKDANNTLLNADGTSLGEDSAKSIDLVIEDCVFENAANALSTTKSALQIKHCSFKGDSTSNANVFINYNGDKTITIENSSVFNTSITLNCNDCVLTNNTISSLSAGTYGSNQLPSVKLYNNTLGSAILWNGKYKMVGNIFAGSTMLVPLPDYVESSYNIFNIGNTDNHATSTDKKLTNNEIYYILGNIDSSFVYQSDSNEVVSIAIINDVLPDGRSIRFPLTEAEVKTDQNGSARLVFTCPGSVEGECLIKETYISDIDTLPISKSYYGKILSATGMQYGMDSLKCLCGGDSIVYHPVMAVPNLNKKEYFVKEQKYGTGDGSSWENAMNDTMFAYTLANLKNKATFHVAEGTYMPYAKGSLIDTTSLNNRFTANQSVHIYGGYNKYINDENESADPAKYTTLFSGNVDNHISTTYDYKFLNITPTDDDTTVISGISFHLNSKKGLIGENLFGYSSSAKSTLVIDRCTFKDAPNGLLANGYISISNSRFINTKDAINFNRRSTAINISGCEFSENTSVLSYFDESFTMSNSTFVNGSLSINGPTVNLYNNTLLCDSVNIASDSTTKIIGNIFKKISCSDDAIKNSKHNLSLQNLGGTNIKADDLSDVLSYDFGKKQYSLINNGNYTYSVEIINDSLFDGNVIKFPLEETVVTEDQWGRTRMEMTCIGALEYTSGENNEEHGGENGGNDHPESYIYIMWNKILAVDNSSRQFHSYQWYKNGEPIPGATKQYYKGDAEYEGYYSCLVNNKLLLGPVYFHLNRPLTIEAYGGKGKVSVEVFGDIPNGAMIGIYDASGNLVGNNKAEHTMQFEAKPGFYLVKFVNTGVNPNDLPTEQAVKVLVK